MERRHGRRDGIQNTTHTTRATEAIHQMGYLFWRLALVKLAPTAQSPQFTWMVGWLIVAFRATSVALKETSVSTSPSHSVAVAHVLNIE